MAQDTFPTRVLFRKLKDNGSIIALFPDLNYQSGNANFGNIMSYMHVGQHGEADRALLRNRSLLVTATKEEYADLLAELKERGYLPKVINVK